MVYLWAHAGRFPRRRFPTARWRNLPCLPRRRRRIVGTSTGAQTHDRPQEPRRPRPQAVRPGAPGLKDARADLEQNFKATLQAGLGKLDLVTREEFEVQRAVLLRTREKLDAMERAITVLEARLAEPGASRN